MRAQTSQGDRCPARKAQENTVRKAKDKLFQSKLENIRTPKEVFRVTKWHKSTGSYRSSPLKDPRFPDCLPAYTLLGKMEVLAKNLLTNPSNVGDIPMDSPAVPSTSLPFTTPSIEEIRDAILRTGNTAPGVDEIPTIILRHAWPLIEELILSLFTACLLTGHHPACFRQAILVMIQKPNKTDLASPRSYRPIALLSVLGKGLERLIARRMSWIAVRHKFISSQQFGALPGRSAVDLTTCLTRCREIASRGPHS